MSFRWGWLAPLLIAASASAQPRISVKARAWLDGLSAFARGHEVTVRGTLRDDLGQPVPGATLEVRGERASADARGGFEVTVQIPAEGRQRVGVRFPGSSLVGPAEGEVEVVVGRTATELHLGVDSEVDATQPVQVEIALTAADGSPVPGARVELTLDGEALPPQTTDGRGRASALLTSLTPGLHGLYAKWAGDRERLPAEATEKVEATLPLTVDLVAPNPSPASGDPVVLEGRVAGAAGRAPDAEVVLTANGRPAERTSTRGGAFRFLLAADDLEAGDVVFRATGHTAEPGWRDGVSPTVTVRVPIPPPPSPGWAWAPGLLAGAALLGGLWLRRPRPRAAPPPLPEPEPTLTPFEFELPPAATVLEVEVRDAVSHVPLVATVVRLPDDLLRPHPADTDAPPGERARTDERGRARVPGAGRRVWTWAEGYAPSVHELPASVGLARIRLLPLRARLQRLYDEVLRAAGRPPLRFGRDTPREARQPLLARGAPPDPLVELTQLVERACFGARAPRPEDLRAALDQAEAIRASLGRPG